MRRSYSKRDHERYNGGDRNGPARNKSTEKLILKPSADQPIDHGPEQRRKNDYA
jgi:hypothetical protein